ncbi:dihydroorotate dehydrogenase [Didymosphaeria variabile]|uniref:Dihydroorotate dehydrogenase (fumarate) n=1 Tax=Didymosphaeria variabile TaxID=1932322 RepID=A0A9W8XLJ6_9PLEO|nr:dihydroorotate dehydrogenase [Didymosphaeria variabile]KAJ4353368.1 dihydroorotate dehydrogenase [Didymosphaeria variabile]
MDKPLRSIHIEPPLLNSANPWCSTLEQLQELYDCPHIGAVTTRTSLLEGFPNDEKIHQFAFFNSSTHEAGPANPAGQEKVDASGSLNTLGYSPLPLKKYLGFIKTISDGLPEPTSSSNRVKPFIISVTGAVEEVVECYKQIFELQHHVRMALAMEVNLSCPNIPGKPPPAYSSDSLLGYLVALKREIGRQVEPVTAGRHTHVGTMHVPIGIKTPPYTYHDQYQSLINALLESAKAEPAYLPCPISFITATNTLGSSLLLRPIAEPTMTSPEPHEYFHHVLNSTNGTGIGGLAGAPLHPIALGNVYTIKGMLFQHDELNHIYIIGVGGVEDAEGYKRMRAVGATAVGIGTALGRKGIQAFADITKGLLAS